MSVPTPSDPEQDVRMHGYRRHEPDLIEDPHYWMTLLGNPYEVLCGACGQMETQNGEGRWVVIREGNQ